MKNKTLFTLLGMFFLISLIGIVQAQQQSLGTFKQNSEVMLIQTCEDSTYSNITRVSYPSNQDNNFFAINEEVEMTKNGDNYNYSFSNTSYNGQHIVYGHCDENGVKTNWVYDFLITPSGTKFTSALSIPIFLPIGIMVIISFFFLFISGLLERKEYKFTMVIFSGLFFILSISYGIIASREFLAGFPNLYNFINSFYKLFIIGVSWGAIIVVVITMFFVVKRAFDTRGYNISLKGGYK